MHPCPILTVFIRLHALISMFKTATPNMRFLKSLVFLLFTISAVSAGAQRIVYSEPEREDTRRMNFEIVGKVSGNFLIYKNIRGKSWITVYNNDMEQIGREAHDYMQGKRLINVDFFSYPDFSY